MAGWHLQGSLGVLAAFREKMIAGAKMRNLTLVVWPMKEQTPDYST